MSARRPPAAPNAAGGATNNKSLELISVIKNIPSLFAAERAGKLQPAQINNLRTMLFSNAKAIIVYRFTNHQPHPLRNLTDTLNPTKLWNGQKPLATEQQFELTISSVESEMVAKQGQGMIALVEASAKGSTASLAGGATATTSASGAGSPATPGGASTGGTNTPAPLAPIASGSSNSASASGSNPVILTNGAGTTILASEVFSAKEMKAFVEMDKTKRETILSQTPGGRDKFGRSVKFWTEGSQNNPNPNAQTPGRPPVRPILPSNQSQQARFAGQPSQPSPGGMYPNRMAPQPVHVPEEVMEVRRRRKFNEYMMEIFPGMEVEIGVNEILEEVMDTFVMENAKGALRLAKHRKSDKVEVKDIAFYLDKTHNMKVPGFDAQLAEKVRLPPEEKKGRVTRASAAAAKKAGKEGE